MGEKLVSPTTYWRRRVIVLAACLAVLGLPLWAVNEELGGGHAPGHGSPRVHPGHATGTARSRAERSLAGDSAHLGLRPRADPQPSASPSSASVAAAHRPARRACPALTLRSARHRYGPGEPVTFVVGAVSARNRPCRADLGPRFTAVVVAFGGTPVWDSSSCPRGALSRVVVVRRGAPAFVRVTWDRRSSLSGCPGQGSEVRAGTYTAAAFYGQLRSQTTTFVLGGRGAAMP